MFSGWFTKKGLKNPDELSKFKIEAFQGLVKRIRTPVQLYQFVMEDVEGASQGNIVAKQYVQSLGLFKVEYENALYRDSSMDDDDSAQEYLNNVVSPALIKSLGLETAVLIRCELIKSYINDNKKVLDDARLKHARYMLSTSEERLQPRKKEKEWIEVINHLLSYGGKKPIARDLTNVIPRNNRSEHGSYYDLYQDISEYLASNEEIPHDIMTPLNYAFRFSYAALYAQGLCTKEVFDSFAVAFNGRNILVGAMLSKEEQIKFQEDSLTQASKWINTSYDERVERNTMIFVVQAARQNLCLKSAVIMAANASHIPDFSDSLDLNVITSSFVTMFFNIGGWMGGEDSEKFIQKVYAFLHEPNLHPYIYLLKDANLNFGKYGGQKKSVDHNLFFKEIGVNVLAIISNNEVIYINQESNQLYKIDSDGDAKLIGRSANMVLIDQAGTKLETFVAFDEEESYALFTAKIGMQERFNYLIQNLYSFYVKNMPVLLNATNKYTSQYIYTYRVYKKDGSLLFLNNSNQGIVINNDEIFRGSDDQMETIFWE